MASSTSSSGAGSKNAGRVIFWPVFVLAVVAVSFWAANRFAATHATVAFITADDTPYWSRVIEGAQDAAEQYAVDLRVTKCDGTLETQNKVIASALADGVDGIAISPVNAIRQSTDLRSAARQAKLITMDSDSELSDRVCFVGMDNYNAGRDCAGLIRRALPDGGTVLIVAGPLDKANGQERRQGIIDSLLSRDERSPTDADPLEEPLTAESFTIARTLEDDLDPAKTTAMVSAYLSSGEPCDAIVGLYAYHAPAIAAAIEQAAPDRGLKVIGFDALPETLAAVEAGSVFGVIAQDQYGYGFHSVRMAAEAAEGYDNAPLSGILNLPPKRVTKETVSQMRSQMKP